MALIADAWMGEIAYAIVAHGANDDARLSYEHGCGANLVIKVNNDDAVQAVQRLLGVQRFSPATGALSRTPPLFHPRWRYLRCMEVSGFKGVGVMVNEDFAGIRIPTYKRSNGEDGYTFLACRFDAVPWVNTWDDATLAEETAGEWMRYTQIENKGMTEWITRPRSAFIYDAPATVYDGQPVDATLSIPQRKRSLRIVWHRVPVEGFLDPDTLQPTNVDACQGLLNDDTWFGYPAGTVLFRHYELQATPNPDVDVIDLLDVMRSPQVMRVTMDFQVYQPDPSDATKGWNYLPAADNRFHLVKSVDGGHRMVGDAHFPNIFKGLT